MITNIDLSKDQIIEVLNEYSDDIDFIVDIVDNMTRNYNQLGEVISRLFMLLPTAYKQNTKNELNVIEP